MKLRLRVIDPSEVTKDEVYVVVALAKDTGYGAHFDQKIAVLEAFAPPALEWEAVEIMAMP